MLEFKDLCFAVEENGKEKVVAALMRKGFSYGDIKSAFYRIENEEYV